jgi:hypothetical protein
MNGYGSVTMRRPLDSAAEVARGALDEAGSSQDIPSAGKPIAAVRRYERIEFDVSDGADSDGFLFQYGVVNWFAEPTFTLGFVRQLEMVDTGGEHEAYLHVQLEYRYRVDADLESQSAHSWWFRGQQDPFEEWLGRVERDPIWGLVGGKTSTEFDVSQDLA